MPRVIDTELCSSCGLCYDSCPDEAIEEEDGVYVIDAELCTDCGDCEEDCPEEAISVA